MKLLKPNRRIKGEVMSKWEKIAELRQERIYQLEEDVQRYRKEVTKLQGLIDRWESIANEWKEQYYKVK